MADAKDGFFDEPVPVTDSTDDHLNGFGWSVAVLHAIRPRLNYRNDEVNDTLRKGDPGGTEC
jgi:hypothetical protein